MTEGLQVDKEISSNEEERDSSAANSQVEIKGVIVWRKLKSRFGNTAGLGTQPLTT